MEKARKKETWVYQGLRVYDGKAIAQYDRLKDGKLSGKPFAFAGRQAKKVTGCVYTVEAGDTKGVYYLGTLKYQEAWHNAEDRVKWDLLDDAAQLEVKAKRTEKSERYKGIAEALQPIRMEYLLADSMGRAAIEIALLRALRRR